MKYILILLVTFGLSITAYSAQEECNIGDADCQGTGPIPEPLPSAESVGSGDKTGRTGIESTNCHNNDVALRETSNWRQYAKSHEGGAGKGRSGSEDGSN